MTSSIQKVSRQDIEHLVDCTNISPADMDQFRICLRKSGHYWIGFVNGKVVGVYGLILPSLLSDQAYIRLHTTPAWVGNEFICVRHSRIAVDEMLKVYPMIVGHTKIGARNSIKWLKWLGAQFGHPENGLIPFTIRAKENV